MELYQIGRFLDLDILAQNCEDAIVQVKWRSTYEYLLKGRANSFFAEAEGGLYFYRTFITQKAMTLK
jgi:hypothetical protein